MYIFAIVGSQRSPLAAPSTHRKAPWQKSGKLRQIEAGPLAFVRYPAVK